MQEDSYWELMENIIHWAVLQLDLAPWDQEAARYVTIQDSHHYSSDVSQSVACGVYSQRQTHKKQQSWRISKALICSEVFMWKGESHGRWSKIGGYSFWKLWKPPNIFFFSVENGKIYNHTHSTYIQYFAILLHYLNSNFTG